MFFFKVRWIRRLLRKTMPELPQQKAEKWFRRLSILYVFITWNTLGGIIYMAKTGRLDYAAHYGLKTEQEASKSKAVIAMEMYNIPKARVITANGLSLVNDEEVVNLSLLEEEEDENETETKNESVETLIKV